MPAATSSTHGPCAGHVPGMRCWRFCVASRATRRLALRRASGYTCHCLCLRGAAITWNDRLLGTMARPKLYWEDFRVGDTEPMGERRLEAAEMVAFAQAFDPQPFHVDEAAARDSMYGGLIASGWHTVALVMRMMADSYLNASASLGSPVRRQRALAEAGAAGRYHPCYAHGAGNARFREPTGNGISEDQVGSVQPK